MCQNRIAALLERKHVPFFSINIEAFSFQLVLLNRVLLQSHIKYV